MPRSPLPRTLLAILPLLGALLAARAGRDGWPIPLSLLAMAFVASACAVIYWSAPLATAKLPEIVDENLPTAFVPHAVPELAAAAAIEEPEPLEEVIAVPEPGSVGTRADSLATGEQYEADLLTNLLAPDSFFARLASELDRCRNTNLTALLVVCDIDGFAEINRTAGLVHANRMLRQVADCFRLTVREGDMLARLGGDEFGLFFPGLPPEVAEHRVRDLRAAVREAGLLTLPEGSAQVTTCVGTGSFPSDGATVETLLAAADLALANAKQERLASADRPVPSALVLTRT